MGEGLWAKQNRGAKYLPKLLACDEQYLSSIDLARKILIFSLSKSALCRYEVRSFPAMNARLLSFLNSVQDAIVRRTGEPLEGTRMVNFHKGIARMSLKDGGAIQVQCFVLADGQSCLKVALHWEGYSSPSMHAVYPTAQNFDWIKAAGRVAQTWVSGPEAAGLVAIETNDSMPALSKLAAIG